MIAASSVPNLSTFQQESPKKTKKYRIETDSETPYMSDVDYRYINLYQQTFQQYILEVQAERKSRASSIPQMKL